MKNNLTIKYKGFIPYVADSFSHKFNQKVTLLRDYHDDTIISESGRTNFKEPKYYSYGYLKTGTTLGTKRGWVLNLPQKGMSIEMEYHPQKFEEVNDLYWVFEGRVFPFPEDATIQTKKITEKFRDEYIGGNLIYGLGKKNYISFDGDNAAIDMQFDSSIEKSNKYYAIYFGDEKNGLFEKGLVTHSLPNAFLYARQFDVNEALLLIIEEGQVVEEDMIYPYSESTDLQEIANDWLEYYYGESKKMKSGGLIKSKGSFISLGTAKEFGIIPNIAGHDMIAKCDCGEKFSYQNSKKDILWQCPECNGMKRIK